MGDDEVGAYGYRDDDDVNDAEHDAHAYQDDNDDESVRHPGEDVSG